MSENLRERRSREEIANAFDSLVELRDRATKGSAARQLLSQRVLALGWVLNHPEVDEIMMSEKTFSLLDVVS